MELSFKRRLVLSLSIILIVLGAYLIIRDLFDDEPFERVSYWRFINPKSRSQFRLKGFRGLGVSPVIYTPN